MNTPTLLENEKAFERDIAAVINRHSKENQSNTPDFILAQFVGTMLGVLAVAIQQREKWYGCEHKPTAFKDQLPGCADCAPCIQCPPSGCEHKAFNVMDEIVRVCATCGAYLGLMSKEKERPADKCPQCSCRMGNHVPGCALNSWSTPMTGFQVPEGSQLTPNPPDEKCRCNLLSCRNCLCSCHKPSPTSEPRGEIVANDILENRFLLHRHADGSECIKAEQFEKLKAEIANEINLALGKGE